MAFPHLLHSLPWPVRSPNTSTCKALLNSRITKSSFTPTTLTCSSAPFYWDQLKVIWNCRKWSKLSFQLKWTRSIILAIKLCFIFIWVCCACKADGWLVLIMSAYNEDIWFGQHLWKYFQKWAPVKYQTVVVFCRNNYKCWLKSNVAVACWQNWHKTQTF